MTNYLPKGWRCSDEGRQRYAELRPRVETLVSRRVRKWNLEWMGRADLLQEGRIAAMYAIDTFIPGKGKLDNYIGVIVENALAMVAGKALAQCRQPHEIVDRKSTRLNS